MQVKSPTTSWQRQLADVIRCPEELLTHLKLDPALLPDAIRAGESFEVRVPKAFLSRMKQGAPNDPLLRQVLPLGDELAQPPAGFSLDPLGEAQANKVPGIVHKYQSRVLLITNGACAVNCRYCFRRHFPYDENNLSLAQWQQSLDYIRANTDINEVILSGGDPLTSPDARLIRLIDQIAKIPQVTRLRIHTRLPIVIPDRVTSGLLDYLQQSRLNIVVVVHSNHAQEIDASVGEVLRAMRAADITVLNQSVLLAGVNDNVHALMDLSERLFQFGALPYYLFLLDPVIGTHHFDVPEPTARALFHDLQTQLPGFLVPRLTREIAGEKSKTLIAPINDASAIHLSRQNARSGAK